MKANCFYEKELEPALLNMSIDLKIAEMPNFESVDDKLMVELKWD